MKVGMCMRVDVKELNVWLDLHIEDESSCPGIGVGLATPLTGKVYIEEVLILVLTSTAYVIGASLITKQKS